MAHVSSAIWRAIHLLLIACVLGTFPTTDSRFQIVRMINRFDESKQYVSYLANVNGVPGLEPNCNVEIVVSVRGSALRNTGGLDELMRHSPEGVGTVQTFGAFVRGVFFTKEDYRLDSSLVADALVVEYCEHSLHEMTPSGNGYRRRTERVSFVQVMEYFKDLVTAVDDIYRTNNMKFHALTPTGINYIHICSNVAKIAFPYPNLPFTFHPLTPSDPTEVTDSVDSMDVFEPTGELTFSSILVSLNSFTSLALEMIHVLDEVFYSSLISYIYDFESVTEGMYYDILYPFFQIEFECIQMPTMREQIASYGRHGFPEDTFVESTCLPHPYYCRSVSKITSKALVSHIYGLKKSSRASRGKDVVLTDIDRSRVRTLLFQVFVESSDAEASSDDRKTIILELLDQIIAIVHPKEYTPTPIYTIHNVIHTE